MDKAFTRIVAQSLGFPMTECRVFKDEQLADLDAVTKIIRYQIGYPCFVKPAVCGSSVGVSKVKNKKELLAAIDDARTLSPKIIVERAVKGREFECGVLGIGSGAQASVPGEILLEGRFYDYALKYGPNAVKTTVTPDIPPETIEEIQRMTLAIFDAVDGRGLVRADFFVEETGRVLFNEMNTMPGFTAISLYAMMEEASGVPMRELLDRLIDIACA
jgi:D-alanine-D-alanine ligase